MIEHLSAECRLLFEHLRDVVFFIRASDGRILTVNDPAEALYGYSRDDLQQMRIWDVAPMPDDEPFPPPDATRNNTINEDGVLFEAVHRKRDGSLFPVEVSARLATIDDVSTVIAIVRDITERVEVQRELRLAYDEIEQLFDTAADGMRVVDSDYNVIRMNRTLGEMTGLNAEAAKGAKCYETFSGPHCHTKNCPLSLIMGGAGALTYEVEKTNPAGENVSCILHAQPFMVDGELVGVVESFRDITDRKRAEELARYLATHDPLTELPNRLLFTDRLAVALAHARRDGSHPALLFCDVDEFKLINDTLGHAMGDEALRSVARSMSASVRETDSVARLGGDEMVVLLSNAPKAKNAEAVARKILDVVHTRSALTNPPLNLSLSIGVALYRDDDDVDSIMRRADAAMYQIKQGGGNGVLVSAD
ncbi:MAG: hypothetical protein CVT67_04250 [Actinobacteria bacterium HGW-Actinobacteria-7]|jgi:diguanylate cyclase (GGDEF)-like protein/PAS domain S-box-containing protein|nr:MAG: hypothetical protein CVT67_04250 [Actinobacteria bacterium HGW-Actinobacteria-7]